MATLTLKLVKYGAIVGSVPALGIGLGYQMRAVQASEKLNTPSRVYRACDLPVYTPDQCPATTVEDPLPDNTLMSAITATRKTMQSVAHTAQEGYGTVQNLVETGSAHSKATLDYVQNDSSDVARFTAIAVAGLGGIVLGYRGGKFKKAVYGTVTATSMASLCYPVTAVEMWDNGVAQIVALWDQVNPLKESTVVEVAESLEEVSDKEELTDKATVILLSDATDVEGDATAKPQVKKLSGDPGQANPEDKDMYSTRS